MLFKLYRLLTVLFLALILSVSIAALSVIAVVRGEKKVYAAPVAQDTYTPTVSITQPMVSEVITTTHLPAYPVLIKVMPDCGSGSGCLSVTGSLRIQIISITIGSLDGQIIVDDTIVTGHISQAQVLTYPWTLPLSDANRFVLTATAANSQPVVGVSDPVTVTVDTVPPPAPDAPATAQAGWITSSMVVYTWTTVSDGAGIARYQISVSNTQGFNMLRATTANSPVFTFTQAFTENAGYYARVQAIDGNGNTGNWSLFGAVITPDLTAPVATVQPPPEHYGLGAFNVPWTVNDSASGVATVTMAYTGPETISGTVHFTASSGSFAFSPASYGVYTFSVYAIDRAGNIGEWATPTTTKVKKAFIYLPVVLRDYPPLWNRSVGTSGIFRSPSYCNGEIWYAGTRDNGVWKSVDNAQRWQKVADITAYPYPVTANPNQCTQAFVRVWDKGVYRIDNAQIEAINNNLGDFKVYGLAITGTTLYAGTNSHGIYKTDTSNINWQSINTGINETRIRSLTTQGNKIYAGARGCKLYVSDSQGASWSEETVLLNGCDDAQVWSVVQTGNILYAGLGLDKGLYYKNGEGWHTVGNIPQKTIYGLTYDALNDILYVSAYGVGVYRCPLNNDMIQKCGLYNAGLSTGDMRELDIGNGILAAGSNDGMWYLSLFK